MDIVLRESERLNTTIRSFLAYARPQRFADRALRRAPRAERRRAAAAQQRRGARRPRHRRRRAGDASCGTRPTKGRSSRSSGTSRPTACARCPTAAGCVSIGAFEPSSDGVVLRCSDEGIGIPRRGARRRCSSRSTARFAKGSGLGLAIVHRIVTDYNGEIQVSSQPGAGTTVVGPPAGARGGGDDMSTVAAAGRAGRRSPPAAHPRRRRRAIDAGAAGDRAAPRRLRGAARRERPRRDRHCSSASRSTC